MKCTCGDGVDHKVDRSVAFCPRRVHMDIRREPYFRRERYAGTGNARRVGLLHHELKVRSYDSIRNLFTQFRKEFGDYVVPSEPFPVLCFKELLSNDAARIDKEISGPGHPFKLADGFVV